MKTNTLFSSGLVFYVYVCSLFAVKIQCLYIDGCPMFGCRPSGSFSFYAQLPVSNASVNWVSNVRMDPVPTPLGCVSNSASVACLSNGVFSKDRSYVSLVAANGSLLWRDERLTYPTLPLLDNVGDLTGSDGHHLVHYDQDGTAFPTIPSEDMTPIFNLGIVGDSFLLLVSGNGKLVVRQTNGVPVGFVTLNETIGNVNGTFVPIAQPVVDSNANRFYVLTSFAPTSDVNVRMASYELRVYAIDVRHSIDDRISVAWNYTVSKTSLPRGDSNNIQNFQSLLFDRVYKRLYVKLSGLADNVVSKSSITEDFSLLAFNETGGLIFKISLPVFKMTKFVTDHCNGNQFQNEVLNISPNSCDSLLWVLTSESSIVGIAPDGAQTRSIDLNKLLGGTVVVTSYISSVRNADPENDTLVFAINFSKSESTSVTFQFKDTSRQASVSYSVKDNTQQSYVVALDTGKDSSDKSAVRWMVPVPNNMTVLGQITVAGTSDAAGMDQLIMYAESIEKVAMIFSIH